MPAQSITVPVEAFIVEDAFSNRTNTINGLPEYSPGLLGSLDSRGMSYFNIRSEYNDRRAPNTRDVNWTATSSPKFMVDQASFSSFVNTINGLSSNINLGFFKIIDRLLFKYSSSATLSQIETYLTTDEDTSEIYIPDSFSISTQILTGTLYNISGTPTVPVPTFARFTIAILSGSTIINYDIKIYVGLAAFLTNYSISTITAVIPPLSYDDLYSDSLIIQNNNIFTTANLTASLSYNTTKPLLDNITITGMSHFNAVLRDNFGNSTTIPFNILYKGQKPTQENMRDAIRAAVLGSNIGNEAGWKLRIPSLFILGRYYIIPLWDKTYTKPDQLIYPNIFKLSDLKFVGNKVLETLGEGDISPNLELLSLYYNKIAAISLPDPHGGDPVPPLITIFPDYQDYSTSEENFQYMESSTRLFAQTLNTLIADELNNNPTLQTPSEEGVLLFYTFEVAEYEMCVITKDNYLALMESSV